MQRVLVTGADGFIGSHLTEALVRSGYKVRALVLYNSFNSWGWLDSIPKEVVNEIEIVLGDIRDPNGTERAVEECQIVFHLAALIAIPYSYVAPDMYVDTNVKGTLNVLQASRRHQVDHIIHTSTSEVYGTAQYVPINEEHPLSGQSPYSASKIGADQLALSFFSSFDLPVTTLRPFNTYGPRQSARAVIPTIITQLLDGESVRLGSTSPTRDFSYVADTVDGFLGAARSNEGIGKVTNLGSGFEISIGETANLIAELMGRDPVVEVEDKRLRPENSEVHRLLSDNTLARERFGWEPKFASIRGLRTGLQETIDWFTLPTNRARYKSDIYNQ